jgi:hypothetical protein
MEPKDTKVRITLTEAEISWLAHIMDHFTDYMAHDDRPDHGLGILKQYRTLPDRDRYDVYAIAGKLIRKRRKLSEKRYNENLPK